MTKTKRHQQEREEREKREKDLKVIIELIITSSAGAVAAIKIEL